MVVTPPAAAASLADGEELGKPDATVKLEIWTDFQCPICGTLVKDYFPRLISDFVQTGQVRIVSHDIAILGATADNESVNAAVGAICAGDQGKARQQEEQRAKPHGADATIRRIRVSSSVRLVIKERRAPCCRFPPSSLPNC